MSTSLPSIFETNRFCSIQALNLENDSRFQELSSYDYSKLSTSKLSTAYDQYLFLCKLNNLSPFQDNLINLVWRNLFMNYFSRATDCLELIALLQKENNQLISFDSLELVYQILIMSIYESTEEHICHIQNLIDLYNSSTYHKWLQNLILETLSIYLQEDLNYFSKTWLPKLEWGYNEIIWQYIQFLNKEVPVYYLVNPEFIKIVHYLYQLSMKVSIDSSHIFNLSWFYDLDGTGEIVTRRKFINLVNQTLLTKEKYPYRFVTCFSYLLTSTVLSLEEIKNLYKENLPFFINCIEKWIYWDRKDLTYKTLLQFIRYTNSKWENKTLLKIRKTILSLLLTQNKEKFLLELFIHNFKKYKLNEKELLFIINDSMNFFVSYTFNSIWEEDTYLKNLSTIAKQLKLESSINNILSLKIINLF